MNHDEDRYECVEPELGEELWRLEVSDTDDDLRRRLEAHVAVCDGCRMTRAVEARVERGLEDGSLRIPDGTAGPVRHLRIRRVWIGALATAASVLWLVGLPPRPLDDSALVRGSGPLTFERPVEGEVVASQSPHLVWTPVDGATSYEITLRAVGRDWVWRSSSDQPDVTVPRSASLPGDCEIRAQVQPVPHDLAPTEGRGVMFRSGSRMDLVAQRLRHGSPLAQTLGVLGILLIAAGFRRRPA